MRHASGLAAVLIAALLGGQALAQDDVIGRGEYMASCAPCHGADADGRGPMADFLTVKPTDLRTIAKRNDGDFPMLRMFEMIDGREGVAAHGGRTMPVWGGRYRAADDERYGPYAGELATRARILELVYYLASIQQE